MFLIQFLKEAVQSRRWMIRVVTICDKEVLEDLKWKTATFLFFKSKNKVHRSDQEASQ